MCVYMCVCNMYVCLYFLTDMVPKEMQWGLKLLFILEKKEEAPRAAP